MIWMVTTMIIGIISDTHVRKNSQKLEESLKKNLPSLDLLIHAGDYTNPELINMLRNHYKFVGVYGNNDNDHLRNELPSKEIITLESYKIGICHGDGSKKLTIDNVYDIFSKDKVDIIIYGHSHKASVTTKHKVLYLNPGSFSNKRKEPWNSYIILELKKGVPPRVSLNFFK